MKHLDPVEAHRSAQRAEHGRRVELRQRVNGQPNGYRAVSEQELRNDGRVLKFGEGDVVHFREDVLDQEDTISLYELYRQERNAKFWKRHEESGDWY